MDGQLRLNGDLVSDCGFIEICYKKRWAILSTANWTSYNARIACNELGFDSK